MPCAKKWSGPSMLDIMVKKFDHRLYECTPRIGGHSTQLKGQICVVGKQLTQQQKLMRMRLQGTGLIRELK